MSPMTGTEAAKDWLGKIPFPPPFEDGKVAYPEGEVEMSPEEYVTLHGMCRHDAMLRATQFQVLNYYLSCTGFLGRGRKVAIAPLLTDLAIITGHEEYEGVEWAK